MPTPYNTTTQTVGYLLGYLTKTLTHAGTQTANHLITTLDDSISTYGNRKLDNNYETTKAKALQDPTYKNIEDRRHNPDGTITLLNNHLTIEDWETQNRIYSQNDTLNPILHNIYHTLANNPIRTFLHTIQHTQQRLTRGWDDTATWSLDTHLAATLGSQLKHLAETTHGWAQSEKYPTFEDWQKALHTHGDALTTYGNRWNTIDNEPSTETKQYRAAQKALHWVASNLGDLWD